MRKRSILVFAFLVLAAPGWPQVTPGTEVDIHQVLSHGINFDHVFFPYKGSQPLDAEQWQAIRENLKESEFKQVAALGFTHVRLNLGRGFLENPDAPDTLNPEGLVLLDQAVQMALKNGLGVVIDMHQTPAPDIFHDPKELAAFQTLWKNLAAHYATYGYDDKARAELKKAGNYVPKGDPSEHPNISQLSRLQGGAK